MVLQVHAEKDFQSHSIDILDDRGLNLNRCRLVNFFGMCTCHHDQWGKQFPLHHPYLLPDPQNRLAADVVQLAQV
jgi:hypothetical protein